jgi:hypothetical protein
MTRSFSGVLGIPISVTTNGEGGEYGIGLPLQYGRGSDKYRIGRTHEVVGSFGGKGGFD